MVRELLRRRGRGYRWARRVIVVGLAWIAVHSIVVTVDGVRDEGGAVDLAVVLGNQVMPDGSLSDRLRARLDRAVEVYRAGGARVVMVSGARGVEGHEEAEVMARYLVSVGVPEGAIVIDNDGRDTWHTARNAARYMRAHGMRSAVAVTQFFHVSRCKLAFRRFGIERVTGAHARYWNPRDIHSLLREFFGYYYYLVRRDDGR